MKRVWRVEVLMPIEGKLRWLPIDGTNCTHPDQAEEQLAELRKLCAEFRTKRMRVKEVKDGR